VEAFDTQTSPSRTTSPDVFYWEHLGMLDRDDCKRACEAKEAWYRANGIDHANALNPATAPQCLITSTESGGQFDNHP